jgi:hypothetical protein
MTGHRRGQEIDEAIVNSAASVIGLVNGGYTRRMPAPVATPALAPVIALTERPNVVAKTDTVAECRAALKAAAAKRNNTMRG